MYLGFQWLWLDNLPFFFSNLGGLIDICGESVLCFIIATGPIMFLLGLILSIIGIKSAISGMLGGIFTLFVPGANFFGDLLIGEIYNVGLGVYICMAGCIGVLIGCFIHGTRAVIPSKPPAYRSTQERTSERRILANMDERSVKEEKHDESDQKIVVLQRKIMEIDEEKEKEKKEKDRYRRVLDKYRG
jgi:hypothetical protein